MPQTNSWLCQYSICQLGRPYWYATSGQISSESLYVNHVKPSIISALGSYALYNNYESQLGVKVHDCSGLIVGALTCDDVNGEPVSSSPVVHGATSQFYACSPTSETMSDFPYIPGTLVFHTNGEYKSHVGIYVGDFIDADGDSHSNAVVEAMGHNWGVTTTDISNDKWDAWGQLECCTIDTKKGQKFDARSSNGLARGNITINTQNMRPFVATVTPNYSNKIDYDKIKAARISAMMFYAGELYDAGHNQHTYANPHLAKLVQDCNDNGMPYALYVNIRARTEIEADKECRTLYYVISRYAPKLGLWLSLQTNNSIQTNDAILKIYCRYLEQWGFKEKAGLYVTPQQLSRISWPSFQNTLYLWLIDAMDVNTVDDELLQPEMFEVPD